VTPITPLLCVSVPVGVKNHLWAITSPDVISGKYYESVGVPDNGSAMSTNEILLRKLEE
jgi:retinol dehydrogenase-12